LQPLEIFKSKFPVSQKIANATLNFSSQPPESVLKELAEFISKPHSERPSRSSLPMGGKGERLFVKIQRVETLPKRLRVMLGRPKRSGRYDWPLEELLNTLNAVELGVDTAPVVGFGVVRPMLGLVNEFVLITEMLDGHIDGLQWLEANPRQVEAFVLSAFALTLELHRKGLVHLDLWAANIMVPVEHDGPLRVIDMENAFTRKSGFCSETLGFQVGFLYKRELERFIDEARFDALAAEFVGRLDSVHMERFTPCYEAAKLDHIGRKQRRKIFLRGELEVG